jgi:catechol 1,2-dioxygenase
VVAAIKPIVIEYSVTEDELKAAGEFFNRMGKSNLFPNILNVAFSMTVVGEASKGRLGTRLNLEGPYYTANAPLRGDGVLYEREPGTEAMFLDWRGVLRDAASGEPLQGDIDIWQADEQGEYDHEGFHLRGVVRSGADGSFEIHTVVPRDYSDHDEDPIGELFNAMGRGSRRAAHIHVKAVVPGYKPLTTQIFVPWSDFIGEDYVEGAVTPDLIMALDEKSPRNGLRSFDTTFDIELEKA